MKFSALALTFFATSASASYTATNPDAVAPMAAMGIDIDAIGDLLGEGTPEALAGAKTLYETGAASTISFQSLSTGGSPLESFSTYYGSPTYGDDYIQAAFAGGTFGDNDFSGMGADGKEQIIKKGAAYLNTYMAAIEHATAAINSCSAGDTDASALSWDKAATLFYGTDGELVYAMGQKRCGNFGTCVGEEAAVNTAIFGAFNAGQTALAAGDCDPAYATAIVQHMQIPLVQGSLRAAYKLDKEDGGEKELGYGTIFAAAILPSIDACSSADATTIATNLAPTATSTDFNAVKTAFENNYDCLGITCEQINGLVDDDGAFLPGAESCGATAAPDAPPAPAAPAAESTSDMADTDTAAAEESSASMTGVVASAAIATAAFAMLL